MRRTNMWVFKNSCRYKLKVKRPIDSGFSDWTFTNDHEVIKKNIEVIESYGWQWELAEVAI
jgi:hypothetical protein